MLDAAGDFRPDPGEHAGRDGPGSQDLRRHFSGGDRSDAHLAWRRENPDLRDLEFPMLADCRKELAGELGILHPIEKVPLRATYLIDPERKIRWLCVNDMSVGRITGEVLRVLAALQCGELCPANWSPGRPTLKLPADQGTRVVRQSARQ